ncbi:hypothetical protein ACFS07_14100 [Undibacterium arcticum]
MVDFLQSHFRINDKKTPDASNAIVASSAQLLQHTCSSTPMAKRPNFTPSYHRLTSHGGRHGSSQARPGESSRTHKMKNGSVALPFSGSFTSSLISRKPNLLTAAYAGALTACIHSIQYELRI